MVATPLAPLATPLILASKDRVLERGMVRYELLWVLLPLDELKLLFLRAAAD